MFVCSYFLDAKYLRIVQAVAALLWVSYGLMIDSMPVVTANGLILVVAAVTVLRKSDREKQAS